MHSGHIPAGALNSSSKQQHRKRFINSHSVKSPTSGSHYAYEPPTAPLGSHHYLALSSAQPLDSSQPRSQDPDYSSYPFLFNTHAVVYTTSLQRPTTPRVNLTEAVSPYVYQDSTRHSYTSFFYTNGHPADRNLPSRSPPSLDTLATMPIGALNDREQDSMSDSHAMLSWSSEGRYSGVESEQINTNFPASMSPRVLFVAEDLADRCWQANQTSIVPVRAATRRSSISHYTHTAICTETLASYAEDSEAGCHSSSEVLSASATSGCHDPHFMPTFERRADELIWDDPLGKNVRETQSKSRLPVTRAPRLENLPSSTIAMQVVKEEVHAIVESAAASQDADLDYGVRHDRSRLLTNTLKSEVQFPSSDDVMEWLATSRSRSFESVDQQPRSDSNNPMAPHRPDTNQSNAILGRADSLSTVSQVGSFPSDEAKNYPRKFWGNTFKGDMSARCDPALSSPSEALTSVATNGRVDAHGESRVKSAGYLRAPSSVQLPPGNGGFSFPFSASHPGHVYDHILDENTHKLEPNIEEPMQNHSHVDPRLISRLHPSCRDDCDLTDHSQSPSNEEGGITDSLESSASASPEPESRYPAKTVEKNRKIKVSLPPAESSALPSKPPSPSHSCTDRRIEDEKVVFRDSIPTRTTAVAGL